VGQKVKKIGLGFDDSPFDAHWARQRSRQLSQLTRLHSAITKSRRNRLQLQQSNSERLLRGLTGECHQRTAHAQWDVTLRSAGYALPCSTARIHVTLTTVTLSFLGHSTTTGVGHIAEK